MKNVKTIFSGVLLIIGISACDPAGNSFPPEFDEPIIDSTTFRINLISDHPLESTQILIYRDDGRKSLEALITTEKDHIEYDGPVGGKIIVAVANSRSRLNKSALETFDSAELLTCAYAEEKPSAPLMSATTWMGSGSEIDLELTPLLCEISISEVTNNMNGYRRLEDPRVYLKNVATTAELLKESSFFPVETSSDTTGLKGLMWERLPYDIGMYPQTPGTPLRFYPNSSETTRTILVFEFGVRNQTFRYEAVLPPSNRGRKLKATLKVRETDDYDFNIY